MRRGLHLPRTAVRTRRRPCCPGLGSVRTSARAAGWRVAVDAVAGSVPVAAAAARTRADAGFRTDSSVTPPRRLTPSAWGHGCRAPTRPHHGGTRTPGARWAVSRGQRSRG
jgi:hypothetical protein